jgi:hypothetical protein
MQAPEFKMNRLISFLCQLGDVVPAVFQQLDPR